MTLNNNFALNNQGVSNAFDTINMARHRWYYYKEGYSPLLVEKAIEYSKISKDDIVLDPFNGSGTTTLTAATNGYYSIGIEVNPFTAFLSAVKNHNTSIDNISNITIEIKENIKSGNTSPLKGFSTFSKSEKNSSKWLFNDSVLDSFEGGWSYTESLPSEIKDIFKLALITAAMKNCNAKRDGKCLRYRSSWLDNIYDDNSFLTTFEDNLQIIIEDISLSNISTIPTIINGDAREVLRNSVTEKFKLCITSPPYLNTFDYTDIYRPELFLGKFVKTQQELYDLRLKTVRSHIQASWTHPTIDGFGELYDASMKHVLNHKEELMNPKIPLMIQAYFEDMLNILTLLREKAHDGAQLWIVVSNSAYADKEIPVDLIIGDMAKSAQWKLKEIGVLRNIQRRKTKHSPNIKTLRESVIIMETL